MQPYQYMTCISLYSSHGETEILISFHTIYEIYNSDSYFLVGLSGKSFQKILWLK